MEKREKIKITILAIVAILVTIFAGIAVYAAGVDLNDISDVDHKGTSVLGKTVKMNYSTLANGKYTFCTQHHKKLRSTEKVYKVEKYVHINGRAARKYGSAGSDGTKLKSSNYNAAMAYVFNLGEGYGNYPNFTDSQKTIWHYEDEWAKYLGFSDWEDYSFYKNGDKYIEGYNKDTNKVTVAARKYARSIGDLTVDEKKGTTQTKKLSVEDTTEDSSYKDKSSKELKVIKKKGKQYAGPINWTYEGEVSKLKVTVGGKDAKIVKFKGNNATEIKKDDLDSEEDFYIELGDISTATESIPIHIDLDTKMDDKAQPVIVADVWFCKTDDAYQNLIHVNTKEYKVNGKGNGSADYIVKPTSKEQPDDQPDQAGVGILKVDADDNTGSLHGFGFTFQIPVKVYEWQYSYYITDENENTILKNHYTWNNYTAYLQNGEWVINGSPQIHETDQNGIVSASGNLTQSTNVVNDDDPSIVAQYGEENSRTVYADFASDQITAYEVKVPKDEPNNASAEYYGYQNNESKQNTPIYISRNSTYLTEVENKQDKVMLSGFVWINQKSEKQTVDDPLYEKSKGDEELNGITVRLMEGNTVVKTTETGHDDNDIYPEVNDGVYRFTDVNLDKLRDGAYHVEFEYDGMKYQAVTPQTNLFDEDENTDNYKLSSKAAEISSERDALDSKFSSIDDKNDYDNNKQTLTVPSNDTANGIKLTYKNISNYKSEIDSVTPYPVHASTDEAGFSLEDHFKTSQKEIKYVNLGLSLKAQADYALVKDLDNVRINVNNRVHVYEYGTQKYNTDGSIKNELIENENDDTSFNVSVKFQNNRGTYNRPVYPSDVYYAKNGNAIDSNKLSIHLVYKITLRNESPYLGRVNAIYDYYDQNLEIESVGTSLDNQRSVSDNNLTVEDTNYNVNGYNRALINVNEIISAEASSDPIYIQFKVKDNGVIKLINDKSVLLNNVAEIESYTTFKNDDTSSTLAVYDEDSVPGNTIPGQPETYEDDTDAARSFKLTLSDPRRISGTVFVDNTNMDDNKTFTGQERKGDGIYNSGDKTLSGVTVRLIDEETGNVATLYSKADNSSEITKNDAETTTDSSGKFEFKGFVPGKYRVMYIWGNKEYPVQYYKSTTYDNNRITVDGKINNQQNSLGDGVSQIGDYSAYKEFWYKGYGYQSAEGNKDYDVNPYTQNYPANDATDAYTSVEDYYSDPDEPNGTGNNMHDRESIDKQITQYISDNDMTNYINGGALQNYADNTGINTLEQRIYDSYPDTTTGQGGTGKFITKMDSYTPTMEISVDFDTLITQQTDDNQDNVVLDYAQADFGIVKRPLQELTISKRVSEYKLLLANGQVLVDTTVDENGNLTGNTKSYTTVMPVNSTQGLRSRTIKTEMDNELIEGATIEITYQITVSNIGEIDYMNERYYKYLSNDSKIRSDLVRIKPTQILDYVDGEVNLGELGNNENKIIIDNRNGNNPTQWEVVPDTYTQYFNTSKWKEKEEAEKNNTTYDGYLNKVKPYITRSLKDVELEPGHTGTVYLKTSKLLAATDDNQFDNLVETTETKKALKENNHSGSPVRITTQRDHTGYFNTSSSQTVEILPSTGANKNYVMPITIAISAIAVLGVGIFLIKKYVIGRKK